MSKVFRFLLIMLLASPVWAHADDAATPKEPSPAAVAFVAQFSDTHLSGMLSRIGSRQATMMALSQLHGNLLAAVYDAEIDKAVAKHGPAWRRNMALAWTPLLTDEELSSLTTEGVKSPVSEKYLGLRQSAGERMQALSQELFRKILAETVQNTMDILAETETDAPAKKTE